ncbi:YeeE/YedE [Rhodovulum sulfidophilum]|uniref:YeeE/YedE thiosulfate transporter family protein n=1 Tax=Rhodovulum sulfidophilum TaxID=35806 RepID=UPI0005A8E76A|nr:YeeE/YedE thiosulfate transporter family protein [Rhodovulum sulfidophilum]ANB34462.1 YeeE/YedE [Rhodovulum sulfidophilum DSM 1374]ANB38285.1 YeeE/YedE [Rhodovulum sulfidophilum]
MTDSSQAMPVSSRLLPRTAGLGLLALTVLAVAAMAGPRSGALLAIGLGFGLVLEGLRFGFTGPWRRMILQRDASGLVAQMACLALVAAAAFPMLASHPGELLGAHAPVGFAMLGGAFVFGACMQIVLGCGSGTLVNAGSGNLVSVVALPFFCLGSFFGAYHLVWWTGLGALPVAVLAGGDGLALTLVLLASVAGLALALADPGKRAIPGRYWAAAILLAGLAILHLAVAGQPWGVVYGLGLWVAKGASALGADLSGSAFWSAPGNVERVRESVLTDVTSLTDLGLIAGAALAAFWRDGLSGRIADHPARAWIAVVIAGFLLGYSSRLAFGCNIGAFFSGISTGSLHGWAWFAAAFTGSWYGIKLRPWLGLEGRS